MKKPRRIYSIEIVFPSRRESGRKHWLSDDQPDHLNVMIPYAFYFNTKEERETFAKHFKRRGGRGWQKGDATPFQGRRDRFRITGVREALARVPVLLKREATPKKR